MEIVKRKDIEIINKEYYFDDKINWTDIMNISKGDYEVYILTPLQPKNDLWHDMSLVVSDLSYPNHHISYAFNSNETYIIKIDNNSTIQLYNSREQSFKFNMVINKIEDDLKY